MRPIDADALQNIMFGNDVNSCGTECAVCSFLKVDNGKLVGCKLIDMQPTVDPVKHGHWIEYREERSFGLMNFIKCSECGSYHAKSSILDKPKFCDECGAKMDEHVGNADTLEE